jgi:hypothetical protein
MAWAVSRTDMPGKQLVRGLVLATFITPPFLGATSWILLAGPNAGWLNRLYMSVTGAGSGLLDIYTFSGLVFVLAIYSFPYVFVFVRGPRSGVERGRGRRQHPRRQPDRHDPADHAAAGDAWALVTFEAIAIIGSSVVIALPRESA